MTCHRCLLATCILFLIGNSDRALAQQRIKEHPQFQKFSNHGSAVREGYRSGAVNVTWGKDGKFFGFRKDDKTYLGEVQTGALSQADKMPEPAPNPPRIGFTQKNIGSRPRGRQFPIVESPDGKWLAKYRDRNLYLENKETKLEIPITTEGNEKDRTKFGVASWVYGEELDAVEAIWWSKDSQYIAYYGFDEKQVKDYYLAMDILDFQNSLDVEAYPKAGMPNPKVYLYLYDLNAKSRKKLNVDFSSGSDPDIAHYVYQVRWSPDGDELLFYRRNRKQNVMEFCALNPATNEARVILRESNPDAWVDLAPTLVWMNSFNGGKREFLWVSDRDGYLNVYQSDLSGAPLRQITKNQFDLSSILRVDEAKKRLFYTARSSVNPYLNQLHTINLNGSGERRLTDPKYHHIVTLSPTGEAFSDIYQTINVPPATQICDSNGKTLVKIAESDLTNFKSRGYQTGNLLTFTSFDGKTTLWGEYWLPSNFDPTKKYPVVMDTYGGPESGGGFHTFEFPPAATELGFIVLRVEGRGTNGRGRDFKKAVYGKLGVMEIDDHAAAAKALAQQNSFVDSRRVGIYGTSYGGYTSLMGILRHPDIFQVAVSSSPVTDWRNYDTCYTERFMGLPTAEDNLTGYDAGSAMTYAGQLKGRLLLYYGTADNNVHPANTYQIVAALNRAGKSFDLAVGPDQGHSGVGNLKLWEYFVEHLGLSKP